MRKLCINDVKITRDASRVFTWEDRLACEMVWNSLLKFSEENRKVDISNEVSLALSIASRPYCGNTFEVFKITTEYAKNCRLEPDFYANASKDMDVWITVKALSEFDGFYIVGFYLSDIWQTVATEQGWNETYNHMFIRKFVEV